MNEPISHDDRESHIFDSPFHPLDSSLHDFSSTQFGSLDDLRVITPTVEGWSAIMVTCSELGFLPDQTSIFEAGQLYVIQNFGNVVLPIPRSESETEVTRSIQTKGLQDVIICGHLNCRSIEHFLAKEQTNDLQPGIPLHELIETHYQNLDTLAKSNIAAQENVLLQIENVIASLRAANLKARLYAWMTEGLTNRIYHFNPFDGQFTN